jgi:AP-3 complex subunit mu
MLDSDGQPLTTSPNVLREIVLPPSLLSKLLSATNITASLNANTSPSGVFASPIPWRKANVKHASNEIYFDVVEQMDAVVNRSVSLSLSLCGAPRPKSSYRQGITLSSTVWGRIESNAKLTGVCVPPLYTPAP